MDTFNTLLLRLEGPLQAWGDHNSKFVFRKTFEAPTKSGILGMVCSALGLSRREATDYLPRLNNLSMAVRIDRPGIRWWDYHTAGAGIGLFSAEGKIKRTASTGEIEPLVSRREYLCDASFLVALHGEEDLIHLVCSALENPKWPPFLGRKSCPPSTPVLESASRYPDVLAALRAQPLRPRFRSEAAELDTVVTCLTEWRKSEAQPFIPADSETWLDVPLSFDPPAHCTRIILRTEIGLSRDQPRFATFRRQQRPRADYRNSHYRAARERRLIADHHLCVFCKAPATTVQHITYRRAGGSETPEDLRSLCRLCHDAVTMIEYGLGMGLDRINPCEPHWRERIIAKRKEIIAFRSLQTRRRHLQPEEVE